MGEAEPRSVRCIHSAGALLGEGPVWVAAERALYWLDIHGRRIHRYSPDNGAQASWETPFRIASMAPRPGGGFVGGSERGFVAIDGGFNRFEVIGDPEPDLAGNRFNDGKLDLQGRFWAGTMDDAEEECTGSLYRLEPSLAWSRQDSGYAVTNGPAFSPDGRYLYHSDSAAQVLFRFELEEPDGNLRDKQVFARFGGDDGYPDGMTTDRDGCLWIAFWDGWCLRQLSPSGEVMRRIDMPVQRPTSCAFGRESLDQLYVTSAQVGLDAQALSRQPLAGGLFAVETGAAGFQTPSFGSRS
jgi:D-xylonolactonase